MVRASGLLLADVALMASTIPAALVGAYAAGRVVADWDAEASRLRVLEVSD
jgi:hypothetical protein